MPGFTLPCKHIFFCIVPVWRENFDMQDRQLLNAARKAMERAREMELTTMAFPPLGSGHKAFPKPKAARLLLHGIAERLDSHFREVRIVCPDDETLEIFREKLTGMK